MSTVITPHAPAAESREGRSGSGGRAARMFGPDAVVPPASPAWYGSVMGSAILATLSQLRTDVVPFGHALAVGFWGIAVALLIGLSLAFAVRIARSRAALTASLTEAVPMAQWGMVSMGVLATGSATSAVLPAIDASWANAAWQVDLVLWFVGTAIGLLTAVAVPARLLMSDDPGTPTTVWGLAVVPPMVSATVGAGLVGWLDSQAAQVWMLIACVGCFFVALTLGLIVFAIAYRHHWLVESLPINASVTAWLPLGVVGQSTAAAQAIAKQSAPMLKPGFAHTVMQIAHAYGDVMLAVGVPLVLWALTMTARGFSRGMAFSPGWWGMTFPVGTLVLGATTLGRGSHHEVFVAAGAVLLAFLFCTWSVCAASSVLAIVRRRTSASASG